VHEMQPDWRWSSLGASRSAKQTRALPVGMQRLTGLTRRPKSAIGRSAYSLDTTSGGKQACRVQCSARHQEMMDGRTRVASGFFSFAL
jgi:hypothetical protein